MNQLDEILSILRIGAGVAQSINNKDVQGGAMIAGAWLLIVQKSVAALEAHTGKPVDLALLHPIEPLP